jgi:hypothetical protein
VVLQEHQVQMVRQELVELRVMRELQVLQEPQVQMVHQEQMVLQD